MTPARPWPQWLFQAVRASIEQSNSNMIDTPRKAVAPDWSKGGETSTRSAPTMFTPASSRQTRSASKLFGPPTSGVPVPGAKVGSTKSMS